jgi:hypothetical protein
VIASPAFNDLFNFEQNFTMKKTNTPAEKTAPKPKAAKPVATVNADAKPKTSTPKPKVPKKPATATAKTAAAKPEISGTVPERVGLAAGLVWHYLSANGVTTVAKLIREISEEEKIVQRAIGWLAQEGKLSFTTVNQVESIALTE